MDFMRVIHMTAGVFCVLSLMIVALISAVDIAVYGNINYFQKTVLHIALKNGDIEVIKLLLSHNDIKNSQPNKDSHVETALNTAIEKGNIEILNLLLTNNTIEVNSKSIFIVFLLFLFF